MTNKNLEMMNRLIQAKREKSAQQGGAIRHDQKMGEKRGGVKKHKKGGLFDK